jgi:hypothetical protein
MIPALQINLFESVSSDSLTRSIGRHQLDICMLVIEQLKRTYWAADFIYSLFTKARKKLDLVGTRESGSLPKSTSCQCVEKEAISIQKWTIRRRAATYADFIRTPTK